MSIHLVKKRVPYDQHNMQLVDVGYIDESDYPEWRFLEILSELRKRGFDVTELTRILP